MGATSEVALCNLAIARIGGQFIESLDATEQEAVMCKRFYPQLRDQLLAMHPWQFATVRATLVRLTSDPLYGFEYAYQVPSDCLRVLTLDDETYAWTIEDQALFTDLYPAQARYIRRVTNTVLFPPLFTDTLVARLAFELCIPIANDLNKSDVMFKMYSVALGRARQESAVLATDGTPTDDTWILARA